MSLHVGPTLLIDGLNLFLRNFVRSPYLSAHGERAGGLSGMIISVRKLINDFKASNVLVIWDGEGGSQRRKAIYGNYKAGRTVRLNKREDDMAETPEEQLLNLRSQTANVKEYLTMLGVPQVRCDSVEADDLIAYVAAQVPSVGGYVIVSTDQDMLQLIRETGYADSPEEGECPNGYMSIHSGGKDNLDHCVVCDEHLPRVSEIKVWSPIKKVMYDRDRFILDYGVLPENFRLVKALTGDSSDNIDGIKGFGEKTVAKSFPFLLERFSTAADVLEAAADLKGVVGKRLVEEKSRFLENLTLMDLSDPMLSATAARQAREALDRDLGCREVDFRVRLVRDGLSFSGDNFTAPFRDFVVRRRRLLAERPKTIEAATTITPHEGDKE